MNPATEAGTLGYAVGEEVVVTLDDGAEIFNLECMTVMPPALLPSWTIGRIVGLDTTGTSPSYVLRTRLRGMRCMFVAPPSAIEGLA